jgi:hypothetical protein
MHIDGDVDAKPGQAKPGQDRTKWPGRGQPEACSLIVLLPVRGRLSGDSDQLEELHRRANGPV